MRLLLEAAIDPALLHGFEPTQRGDVLTAGDGPIYRFRAADLAVLDEQVGQLVLGGTRSGARWRTCWTPSTCTTSLVRRGAARAALTDVLSRPAAGSAHRISATGHAPIDSAWLWPLRETVQQAFPQLAKLAGIRWFLTHSTPSCTAANSPMPNATPPELHRATYTTQAKTKQENRRSEHALREAESPGAGGRGPS